MSSPLSLSPPSVEEALRLIREHIVALPEEHVELSRAGGRILAGEVISDRDYPPFHRSAMDGYAISTKDYGEGVRRFREVGILTAGSAAVFSCGKGECVRIMTGAPLPPGLDGVIPLEETKQEEEWIIPLIDSGKVRPWLHVARQGEDAKAGEVLLERGTRVNGAVAATLAAVGLWRVPVRSRPTVTILATGDELVSPAETPAPHQIRDSNSYAILNYLRNRGMEANTFRISLDDPRTLRQEVERGLASDLLLISGGVSKGDRDLVPATLQEAGVRQLFHGVKIKPGKPVFLGIHGEPARPVFALPGNPVASLVNLHLLVGRALDCMEGLSPRTPLTLPLAASRKKKAKGDDFFPVEIRREGERSELIPLLSRGSGDFISASRAHGVARHPAPLEQLETGSLVEFYPWI